MFFSKNRLYSLFVLLLLISISSCSEEISQNEFITGYAGTFKVYDIDTDSTVRVELRAFRFDDPTNIKTTVNGFALDSFSLHLAEASVIGQINIKSEGFFSLSLEYDGRASNYSSHLLPKLSHDKIELLEGENQSTLSWPDWEDVNYYSIDIEDTYYNRLAWDTLIVAQNELVFENDFLSNFSELKINVTAVKGPLPNEEYYNLEGDIPGRFLLLSSSHTRWYRQMEANKNLGEEIPNDKNLAVENILNRYRK